MGPLTYFVLFSHSVPLNLLQRSSSLGAIAFNDSNPGKETLSKLTFLVRLLRASEPQYHVHREVPICLK